MDSVEYCSVEIWGQDKGSLFYKGTTYRIRVNYAGGPTRYFIVDDTVKTSDGGLDKWRGRVRSELGKAGWIRAGGEYTRPILPERSIDEPKLIIPGMRETTEKDFS
jgi:hypothetical protein